MTTAGPPRERIIREATRILAHGAQPSVADIAKAAVGLELKFSLRVELGGSSPPPDKVVEKINSLLGHIDKAFRLRR